MFIEDDRTVPMMAPPLHFEPNPVHAPASFDLAEAILPRSVIDSMRSGFLPYEMEGHITREVTKISLRKYLKFVPFALAAQNLSKDPSTKVGAVVLDDDYNIRVTGYNGFPRGVSDDPKLYEDRNAKYPRIVHAEQNCIAQAARTGVSLKGCTIILTALYPCPTCAGMLIQSGITTVLAPDINMPERWATPWVISKEMFKEAGVKVYAYAPDDHQKVREVV